MGFGAGPGRADGVAQQIQLDPVGFGIGENLRISAKRGRWRDRWRRCWENWRGHTWNAQRKFARRSGMSRRAGWKRRDYGIRRRQRCWPDRGRGFEPVVRDRNAKA